jgi:hypothetical protein
MRPAALGRVSTQGDRKRLRARLAQDSSDTARLGCLEGLWLLGYKTVLESVLALLFTAATITSDVQPQTHLRGPWVTPVAEVGLSRHFASNFAAKERTLLVRPSRKAFQFSFKGIELAGRITAN